MAGRTARSEQLRALLRRSWPLYVMISAWPDLHSALPLPANVRASSSPFRISARQGALPIHPGWAWRTSTFCSRCREFNRILSNTLIIAMLKLVLDQLGAIVLALLLHEARNLFFRRSIQTLIYLPHFLSWIVLGGILLDILAPYGIVNNLFRTLGFAPQLFLGSNDWFRITIVGSSFWKGVGFSTIIYLAALTAISPTLHEAAAIDGAGRFRRTWHITLPGIRPTIVLLAALSLGDVLQAGFEQILTLYSPAVYRTGDIIDTYVYRVGLVSAQYSLAGAVGLFKSVIGFILIVISFRLAYRYAGYRIL